jgi:hypothetical protein
MNNNNLIAEQLENNLPEIIKNIAKQYKIESYIQNPDFKEPRLSKWHQFGLITHSKNVRKIFLTELPIILQKLNLTQKINQQLNKKIDNLTKYQLLEISIPLHDLGKITGLKDTQTDRNHELASSSLIEQPYLNQLLSNNLTSNQINYIKKCIKHHGTLGREIRDILVPQNKFNLDYLNTEEFKQLCNKVAERHKDIKLELGIYFLCDTLGKTNIKIQTNTEQEIGQILQQKNLPIELKHAIMQQPLTQKLSEIYLKTLKL